MRAVHHESPAGSGLLQYARPWQVLSCACNQMHRPSCGSAQEKIERAQCAVSTVLSVALLQRADTRLVVDQIAHWKQLAEVGNQRCCYLRLTAVAHITCG